MSSIISRGIRVGVFTVAGSLLAALSGAQTLGTFKWQLQPYCNVLTLTVTPVGGSYALDGFDDQCGAPTRASATGTAFPNPDGSIGIGLSIVPAPNGFPVHVEATINPSSFNGAWRASTFHTGTFAFGAHAAGDPLPVGGEIHAVASWAVDRPGFLIGVSARGSRENPLSPLADQQLAVFAGAGYVNLPDGSVVPIPAAQIIATASENWNLDAWGTRLDFSTTPKGTHDLTRRLTIIDNGNVGISNASPADRLDVNGDIRIGTQLFNGCLKSNGGNAIIGACSSDLRFKRDITSFAPTLDTFVRLRPVHYYWRTAEFPQKHFGDTQAYGLIAQEVAELFPEIVTTDGEGYQTVDYAKLPLLAVQAIKELNEKNDALERRLAALEERLTSRQ